MEINYKKPVEKWGEVIYDCGHCRICSLADYHKIGEALTICPSGEYFGFEAYYPPGRNELVRGIIEGSVKPSNKALEVAFACQVCNGCNAMCKPHTYFGFSIKDHSALYEDLREALVLAGYIPEKHLEFGEWIEKDHNPYFETHESRFDWLEEGLTRKDAEVLYFTGCTSSYRQKNIAKATVNALNKAGVSFDVLREEEWCCGSPLLRTGQREKAIEVARHNVEAIKKRGIKTVVTSCAGCYRTLKVDYPILLGKRSVKFDVIHTSQLFVSMLDEKKVSLENMGLDVTYHDPCHLGRHMEVYDKAVYEEPRDVLGLIANIHEMPRNREKSKEV